MDSFHGTRSPDYASRDFVLLLIIIFFTTFASSSASAAPLPFLVRALAESQEAFGIFIGLLVSVASVAMVSANFMGGFLADKFGRKRTIILGSGILIPSLFAYTIAPTVVWVIGVYFVQMFAMSLFQPAFTALVADMSKLDSRGKAFGRFNLFWIGSSVPAPLVGGFLADTFGLRFPFLIAALVSFVGFAACFGLRGISGKPVLPSEEAVDGENDKVPMPLGSVMIIFGTIGLLTGLANGLLVPLTRLYPMDVLKVNATELGLILSLGSALVTTVVQIPGGRLTDRFGRKSILLFSELGVPFVVALAFTASSSAFILVSAGLTAFGNIAAPAYSAWQMELVACSRRAITSGVINAVTGIGMFFGPFISVWLYQSQPIVAVAFVVAALPWILQIPPILKLKETKPNEIRIEASTTR